MPSSIAKVEYYTSISRNFRPRYLAIYSVIFKYGFKQVEYENNFKQLPKKKPQSYASKI